MHSSMNKQYVEGVQKRAKAYLMSVSNSHVTFASLTGPETTSLLFKEQSQKELRKNFWTVIWQPKVPNRRVNCLREITIVAKQYLNFWDVSYYYLHYLLHYLLFLLHPFTYVLHLTIVFFQNTWNLFVMKVT